MEGEGICHYAYVIKTCQKVEKNEKKKNNFNGERKAPRIFFPIVKEWEKKKAFPAWFHWGSNPGPSACKADVITATLWNRALQTSARMGYRNRAQRLFPPHSEAEGGGR